MTARAPDTAARRRRVLPACAGRLGRAAALAAALLAPLAAGATTREIVVDAPAPFKALLEKNLDVERAARLPEADSPDDVEWARLVAAAPAQAKSLAETEGYFRSEVTARPEPEHPERIHVRLVPGEPARVGRLTLQFDGELARAAEDGDAPARRLEAQVRKDWPLQPGAVFRNADWSGAKAQALQALRAQGYAAATWTATASQVDPATDQARLFLVVDSGPRFRSGDIVVEGLQRQPERNVRLLAGWGTGTPLTETRLRDYQDRLEKTGLFDQVAVIYDPDPAQAAHATVRVHVHEQSIHQAQVSAGYSTKSGRRIAVEHTDRLAFGLPATMTNKLQWGDELKEWDGSVATHPAEGFHSWILGLSLSRTQSTATAPNTSASAPGPAASAATGKDVVRAGYVRFGRQEDSNPLDRLTFTEFERSIQCTPSYCIDARALSLNQQNIWRRMDSVILPTRGYSISGQVGVGYAGGPDSAYGPYLRLYGRLTNYWPLGHEWHGQTRLELGQIIVRPGVAMPDAEQWRAGGEDSVRGYAWRSLAPTDSHGNVVGGNSLVTASVEVGHPFTSSLPSVQWAAFFDAGRAAPRFNDLKMARGFGVGLRWRSPVGPLKVDVSRGQEVHRWRLDLAVGVTF